MNEYNAYPLTKSCQEKAKKCTHVCVGISPFNGYFNQPRITSLVSWALENYESTHFFVPDKSPAHTFEALGYAPNKAAHKARRQGKYVLNKIRTGLRENGIEDTESKLLYSEILETNSRYQQLRQQVAETFESDYDFRSDCLTTSEWVLSGYLPAGQIATSEQKLKAVQYFLDELPMFIDTPGIIGSNQNSTFVYHQEVPFLIRLYDDELSIKASHLQSFTVCQATGEQEPSSQMSSSKAELLAAAN